MQDNFFKLRDTSNRLPDLGYIDQAFASGDAETLITVKAEIDAKSTELAEINAKIAVLVGQKNQAEKSISENSAFMYSAGFCPKSMTRSKCMSKRSQWTDQKIAPVQTKLTTVILPAINALKVSYDAVDKQIKALESELATLLATKQLEAESISTLAEKGLTLDSVKLQAEAEATAITTKAKVEAEVKNRKSKSKKTIIITLVVVAVILVGIWAFRKFRKK